MYIPRTFDKDELKIVKNMKIIGYCVIKMQAVLLGVMPTIFKLYVVIFTRTISLLYKYVFSSVVIERYYQPTLRHIHAKVTCHC